MAPLLVAFIDRQFIHNNPPAPTASFAGKTVIVTGSSSGLGLEASRMLVRLGASTVILACRNVKKAKAAATDIQASTSCSSDTLKVWELDMSSYASCLGFADKVKTELPRLDALLLNAGLGTTKFNMTEDNEETITTNVVSTALLAFLLHPKLKETAMKHSIETHLTITASELYEVAKFKESKVPAGQIFATLNDKSEAVMSDRYNVTKLMEVFLVKQMAAMVPLNSSKVIVNCVAPGFCHSGLFSEYDGVMVRVAKNLLCRPTEVGARTLVHGACALVESHGEYLPDCKITSTAGLTKGEAGKELQTRVWDELKEKLEAIRPGVTKLS